MTNKEKKAIKELKLLCDDILKDDNCDRYDQYSPLEKMTLVSIILNLIEKQQKEIKFQKRKEELINRVIKGYDNNAINADTAIGIYKINLRDLSLGILEE